MTRPSRRSSTGNRLRRWGAAALVAALAASAPTSARDAAAQSLKLRTLKLSPQDLVGTWVSFHGRSQSRGTPIREFDQRLAVVSRQALPRHKWGYWVELKSTDSRSGTRIERGLFGPGSLRGMDLTSGVVGAKPRDAGDGTTANDPPPPESGDDFVLLRYQTYTPGGKLYEYPIGSARSSRATGDVASVELFEYDPHINPVTTNLGPDTLRLGNKVVPTEVERILRFGIDQWPVEGDSTEYRLVLTQTYWRNGVVPMVGFARSLFRTEIMRASAVDTAGADSVHAHGASADSMAARAATGTAQAPAAKMPAVQAPAAPAPAAPAASLPVALRGPLAWTELTLSGLGADARPEVNQEPIMAAEDENPEDTHGFQR